MPELPEVERARKLIVDSCKGYKIRSVDSKEDKIVYTGGTAHDEFSKEITGRTIMGCERKGKTFWMVLDGNGRFPVMHFGMTGMIQLKGQEPTWYRRRPKERADEWPPRFYKFTLELEPQAGSVSDEPRALAFIDARRLGRLRLVADPVADHPPVSLLGFDPILSHPTIDEFKGLLEKKKGTVKGVIMDQAFSAGVGNWVADEVLYQARIHPACPIPALSSQNVLDLHHQLRNVAVTAVGVNADSMLFPEDWLFRWRWSKGKKQPAGPKKKNKGKSDKASEGEGGGEEGGEDVKPKDRAFLALPDGKPATIHFIQVGGRTTALVEELQKMPEGVDIKPKVSKGGKGSRGGKAKAEREDGSDEETTLSDTDEESVRDEVTSTKQTTPRQKAMARKSDDKMTDEKSASENSKRKVQDGEKEGVTPSKSSKARPSKTPRMSIDARRGGRK